MIRHALDWLRRPVRWLDQNTEPIIRLVCLAALCGAVDADGPDRVLFGRVALLPVAAIWYEAATHALLLRDQEGGAVQP